MGPYSWKIEEEALTEYGITSFDDLTVTLRASMPPDQVRETLFHELLHCALFIQGVDGDKQEKWVARISPFLFQCLRDNPELRDFLFRGRG